jgi:hypothetical protein
MALGLHTRRKPNITTRGAKEVTATHSAREKFVAELIRRAPAADYAAAQRLMRYSGTFGRLIDNYAVRTFSEERKLERIQLKVRDLVFDIRCQVTFQEAKVIMLLPDHSRLEVPRV